MFVAIRDLRFAKGRFALMGSVVALLTMLMVLLTGLATGLVDDNISAVRDLPAPYHAFSAETGVKFNQSVVTTDQWQGLENVYGVSDAAPLGNTLFNGTTGSGEGADLALFGVEPGSVIDPGAAEGTALKTGSDGVVASRGFADKHDLHVGDTVTLDRVAMTLTVVGITEDVANFGHVPVVYAPLEVWQRATYPIGGTGADKATVIAITADGGFDPGNGDAAGLAIVTRTAAFAGSPGFSEETGTLTMIQGFLYVIGAVLVGAYFAVWTVQRQGEIGLLKALGASNRYLLRDALGQALIIQVLAAAVGLVIGLGLGAMIPSDAPFSFTPAPVLGATLLVVVLGLLGGALSIRRITRVDPLLVLGAAR